MVWAAAGVWERIFLHLADTDNEYATSDSTIVRVSDRDGAQGSETLARWTEPQDPYSDGAPGNLLAFS
jgi:hypothetical protein